MTWLNVGMVTDKRYEPVLNWELDKIISQLKDDVRRQTIEVLNDQLNRRLKNFVNDETETDFEQQNKKETDPAFQIQGNDNEERMRGI